MFIRTACVGLSLREHVIRTACVGISVRGHVHSYSLCRMIVKGTCLFIQLVWDDRYGTTFIRTACVG